MYDTWDALARTISDSEDEDVVLDRRAAHAAARKILHEGDGDAKEAFGYRFGIGERTRDENEVCSLAEYTWTETNEPAAVVIQVNLPKRSGISIVVSDFRAQSFTVELADSSAQRYRFAIAELSMEIIPQKCECFIEQGRLICKIIKFAKVAWKTLARV